MEEVLSNLFTNFTLSEILNFILIIILIWGFFLTRFEMMHTLTPSLNAEKIQVGINQSDEKIFSIILKNYGKITAHNLSLAVNFLEDPTTVVKKITHHILPYDIPIGLEMPFAITIGDLNYQNANNGVGISFLAQVMYDSSFYRKTVLEIRGTIKDNESTILSYFIKQQSFIKFIIMKFKNRNFAKLKSR